MVKNKLLLKFYFQIMSKPVSIVFTGHVDVETTPIWPKHVKYNSSCQKQ